MFFVEDAGSGLHHYLKSNSASPCSLQTAPPMRTSDAISRTSSSQIPLLLVRPFTGSRQLVRPLLTSRSGSTPSPFQAQGEISPGKNALLHCTAAGFTSPPLGHKSFAVSCPLALVGNAFYPVLVIGPQFRSTLPPHTWSPSCSCVSLHSL